MQAALGPAAELATLTELLARHRMGDRKALTEVFERTIPRLRAVARALMQKERASHTLQPTALINEAYLRAVDGTPADWQDGTHFLRSVAGEMRRVLVDYARRSASRKRSRPAEPGSPVDFLEAEASRGQLLVLDIKSALDELGQIDERAVLVVDLMGFGGLTAEETAALLKVSSRTVDREWRWACAWLRARLAAGNA